MQRKSKKSTVEKVHTIKQNLIEILIKLNYIHCDNK